MKTIRNVKGIDLDGTFWSMLRINNGIAFGMFVRLLPFEDRYASAYRLRRARYDLARMGVNGPPTVIHHPNTRSLA